MTIDELKNEVEIQNLQKYSELANTFEHNIKCIDGIEADEQTKENILDSIKKEFASKSLKLRKQLTIVLNEIENAKNLDNIVLDELFKKAQIQVEKEELEEKIKEKQKLKEDLNRIQEELKTVENNDIDEYIQNINDDGIRNNLSQIKENHNNNNTNKKSKKTKEKKNKKETLDLLNENNLTAKGANKITLSNLFIAAVQAAYKEHFIKKKLKKKIKNINNNVQNTTQNNNQNTVQDNIQNTTQDNNQNTSRNNTQNNEQNNNQNAAQDNTQNTNQDNNQNTSQNDNQNTNENRTTIELDPVHKARKRFQSDKYKENIKGLLDSYEKLEPYYYKTYRKKENANNNNQSLAQDNTQNTTQNNNQSPAQDNTQNTAQDTNQNTVQNDNQNTNQNNNTVQENTNSNNENENLSQNNTRLNGGNEVFEISNLFKEIFKKEKEKNNETVTRSR